MSFSCEFWKISIQFMKLQAQQGLQPMYTESVLEIKQTFRSFIIIVKFKRP